jgi:multiple antibiotic resistance protein
MKARRKQAEQYGVRLGGAGPHRLECTVEAAMLVRDFLLSFVPLFFAMDAVGVMPLFLNLTEGMDARARGRVIGHTVITATAVGVGFVLFGRTVFSWLGVTIEDFMVAGGAMLFLISATDLVSGKKLARRTSALIGAVPLGTPLIVGPAVLTMALILVDIYGWAATVAALGANVALAAVVLASSGAFIRILGRTGVGVASKIASLILAAIAVMMIRRGIVAIIQQM